MALAGRRPPGRLPVTLPPPAGLRPIRPIYPIRPIRPGNRPGSGGPGRARPRSYRLSNTAQSRRELARNPRAILLRNALIDTTRPLSLAIPEALRSHGAPGSYLVQSDRALNAEFYAALRRDGAEFVSYIPEQRGAGAGDAGGGAGDGGGPGVSGGAAL